LIIGGFAVHLATGRNHVWDFIAVVFAASLVAVLLGLVLSAINGGYYFGLMKGPAYVAAAALVARAHRPVAGRLAGGRLGPAAASPVAAALIVVALAAGTFWFEPSDGIGNFAGVEHAGRFVEASGRGRVRVFSNDSNATVLMEYQEILAGRMDIGSILDSHRQNWVRQTVSISGLDAVDCRALPERYLVLWRRFTAAGQDDLCDPVSAGECRDLFFEGQSGACRESDRTFCYYECRSRPPVSSIEVMPGTN
jgi:hypothetical protein